jgi:hypothetical protein
MSYPVVSPPRAMPLPVPPKELKWAVKGLHRLHKAWARQLRGRDASLIAGCAARAEDDAFLLAGGGIDSLVRGLCGKDLFLREELLRVACRALLPPFAEEANAPSRGAAWAPPAARVRRALALLAAGEAQGVPSAGLAALTHSFVAAPAPLVELALAAFRGAASAVLRLPPASPARERLVAALGAPDDSPLVPLVNYVCAAAYGGKDPSPPAPGAPPGPPRSPRRLAAAAAAVHAAPHAFGAISSSPTPLGTIEALRALHCALAEAWCPTRRAGAPPRHGRTLDRLNGRARLEGGGEGARGALRVLLLASLPRLLPALLRLAVAALPGEGAALGGAGGGDVPLGALAGKAANEAAAGALTRSLAVGALGALATASAEAGGAGALSAARGPLIAEALAGGLRADLGAARAALHRRALEVAGCLPESGELPPGAHGRARGPHPHGPLAGGDSMFLPDGSVVSGASAGAETPRKGGGASVAASVSVASLEDAAGSLPDAGSVDGGASVASGGGGGGGGVDAFALETVPAPGYGAAAAWLLGGALGGAGEEVGAPPPEPARRGDHPSFALRALDAAAEGAAATLNAALALAVATPGDADFLPAWGRSLLPHVVDFLALPADVWGHGAPAAEGVRAAAALLAELAVKREELREAGCASGALPLLLRLASLAAVLDERTRDMCEGALLVLVHLCVCCCCASCASSGPPVHSQLTHSLTHPHHSPADPRRTPPRSSPRRRNA